MIINAKKIVTAAATVSLVFGTLVPSAFASTTLEISGNGSSSDNSATVTQTNTNTVTQSNTANISNHVDSHSDTGGNSANDNTGGNTRIDTGNSSSSVDLRTKANVNVANTPNCNCNGDTSVLISGNGSRSENEANVTNSNSNEVFQTNDARINNHVDVNGNTGDNDANRNTGGDVTVITGHASSDVMVSNQANANIARSTSGVGSGTGTLSARILGNGSNSDNDVTLDHSNSNTLVQDNSANIYNDVNNRLTTGRNDANDNTGGDSLIDTGNALSSTDVRNSANFNWAELDCGCLLDATAKVSGNGSDSENELLADLSNDSTIFQNGNDANFRNDVDGNAKTGDNDTNRGTGSVNRSNDPTIITGHSMSDVSVSNASNANVVGSGPGLAFTWDLGGLWSSLGL